MCKLLGFTLCRFDLGMNVKVIGWFVKMFNSDWEILYEDLLVICN